MKAFMIGSGTLGSTTAFLLAENGLYDEIVLYDPYEPLAQNHVLDLSQSLCLDHAVTFRVGTPEDIAGSDLVVMAAGVRGAASADFVGSIVSMAPMIEQVAQNLRNAPNAIVITMTNPVDALSYLLCRLSGLPEKQFLGFTWNDSLRFRWSIAQYLQICPEQVDAYMVGEHGRTKVSVWSDVKIDGQKRVFAPEEREAISAIQNGFWEDFMKVGHLRTAGWSTAYGALQQIRHVRGEKQGWCPCSVIRGNVSAGGPAKLGREGLVEAKPLQLDDEEQALYEESVSFIRSMIDAIAEKTGWMIV